MPRLRFLVFAGLVLGLLHAYIGLRLFPVLALPAPLLTLGWLLLAASAVLQPLSLVLREGMAPAWRDRLSWVAMLAMGLFSSLLVFTLLRDVFLLGLSAIEGALSISPLPPAFMSDTAQFVLVAAVLVSVLGFFNARRLARVVEVEVPLRNLPPALHGFRIAQISDIHVGPTIKRNYLERIVGRVNGLQADLVAITGDLVDGSVAELRPHVAPLAQLRARHGVYFVTGNHEYYSGVH